MSYFGEVFTPEISSGNVRTALDLFDATKPNNGARNPLGAKFRAAVITAANPNGAPAVYRYVRYNSTANSIAVQSGPAVVYYTDATFTTVTGKFSESLGLQSYVAGYLLLNSTDKSGLTAAILNGNFCWIAVAGFVSAAVSAATTAGDQLIATGDMSTTGGTARIAGAAATTGRVAAYASAASPGNINVVVESI